MQKFYAARPISTYGTPLGEHYLAFLRTRFSGDIVDPSAPEVERAVDAIKAKYPTQEDYDKFGGKEVMEYFAGLVLSMKGGAGLALPMEKDGKIVFAIPAGIAKELETIHNNGYPTWIVTCKKSHAASAHVCPHAFKVELVTGVSVVEVPSSERGGKETLRTFKTASGSFAQLTIQETRERVYCWPDRTRFRPYFLDDAV